MMVEMRDGGTRTRHALAGFMLAHLVIVGLLFQSPLYPLNNSGIGLYFADMNKFFAGQVPYRDFVLEYPPFAILFFAIPRLFGASYTTYYAVFQVEILLCDLAILATLAAIARGRAARSPDSPQDPIVTILGAYTLFLLAIGPIIAQQFDLFATAMVLLAVWFASRRQRALLWIFLALGVMTKLYPVLLAPVFIIEDARQRNWKQIGLALGVSIATCAAVMLPLFVVAPTAIKTFFAYHAKRGIQLESTYAAVLLVADKVHILYVGIGHAFGSFNVTGWYANAAAQLSTYVLLASLVASFVFLYRYLPAVAPPHRSSSTSGDAILGTATVLVVFVVLVTSKVLSPQYMMWALPLVPLVDGPRRTKIWALFTVTCTLTYYIFPTRYPHLVRDDALDVLLALVVRNALLMVLVWEVARAVRELARASSESAISATAPVMVS